MVFSTHSRRLLKQSAFSVNLSISAAEALTAGWVGVCVRWVCVWGWDEGGLRGEGVLLPGEHSGGWLLYLFMCKSRVLWGSRWESQLGGGAAGGGGAVTMSCLSFQGGQRESSAILDIDENWPTPLLRASDLLTTKSTWLDLKSALYWGILYWILIGFCYI